MNLRILLRVITLATLVCATCPATGQQDSSWQLVAEVQGAVWGGECASASHCMIAVVAGVGIESHVKVSTDGGTTWSMVLRDTGFKRPERWPLRFFDLAYPAPELAIVAADSGWIFRTTDGGANWAKLRIDTVHGPTHRISMYDAQSGVATLDYPYRLYVTSDGGLSWREIEPSLFRPPGWEIFPLDPVIQTGPSTILAILDDTVYHRAVRSTDHGRTRTIGDTLLRGYPDARVLVAEFVDTLRGWATTRYRAPGAPRISDMILRTVDGGITWQVLEDSLIGRPAISVYNVEFVDSLNGLVDAWNFIFRTRDGGSTWTIDSAKGLEGGISRLVYETYHPGIAFGPFGRIYRYLPNAVGAASPVDDVGRFSIELDADVVHSGATLVVDVTSQRSTPASFEIYTLGGERIGEPRRADLEPERNLVMLPLPALAAGTYVLHVRSGATSVSRMFRVVK